MRKPRYFITLKDALMTVDSSVVDDLEYEEYADQLRSEIADMVNSGGRPAGACTAAMFLKEFAGGLPWAHLDVAGTAWAEEAKPYQPKGATGIAVRTLAELPFTWERWK